MGQGGVAIRRHDIDFIRVMVFAVLMLYHASLIFGTRSWLVNADSPSRIFDLVSLVSHPWRISLLFMISGISTAALSRRLAPADIRGLRSRQLIPPLLFGVFVIVPPQIYVALRSIFDLKMPYLEFWETYLRFGSLVDQDGAVHSLVSLEHLWFLAYLWLYGILLTLCPLPVDLIKKVSARLTGMLQGYGLLAWPIVYLSALRLVLYPVFGETLEIAHDWYAHVVYFGFFVFGYLIADDERFWTSIVAQRGRAALVAAASLALITGLFLLYPPGDRGSAVTMLHRVGRSAFQWSAIVAIFGICRVAITAPHPVISYFNKAMLSYYVLHQTIMLVFAYWLKQTYGLGSSSFPLLVLATIACCMLLYEMKRRTVLLLKSKSRMVDGASGSAA
jgi:glucan biosynthesis protein C